MYFLNRNTHTAPFVKDSNILAFPDKISLWKLYFYKELFQANLTNTGSVSLQIHIHITQDGLI